MVNLNIFSFFSACFFTIFRRSVSNSNGHVSHLSIKLLKKGALRIFYTMVLSIFGLPAFLVLEEELRLKNKGHEVKL